MSRNPPIGNDVHRLGNRAPYFPFCAFGADGDEPEPTVKLHPRRLFHDEELSVVPTIERSSILPINTFVPVHHEPGTDE